MKGYTGPHETQVMEGHVELYDHHCPFINNCLGYKNHKFFLVWITLYSIFLIDLLLEMVRHIYEFVVFKWNTNLDYGLTALLIAMIFIHLPIIAFQVYSQCKNLCKRPVNTFTTSHPRQIASGENSPKTTPKNN